MVKVIVQTSNSDRGAFKKGETGYRAKETAGKWKLVAKDRSVKIELEWSKKDFPTFEAWAEALAANGYERA